MSDMENFATIETFSTNDKVKSFTEDVKVLIETDNLPPYKYGDIVKVDGENHNSYLVVQKDATCIHIPKSKASILIKPWEATKAVEEGEAIDVWSPDVNKWASCNKKKTRLIDLNCLYRLTPLPEKPKYVPFTWEDWEVFCNKPVRFKSWTLPLFSFIESFSDKKIGLKNGLTVYTVSYDEALEKLEFIDGTPFGKLMPNEQAST